MLTHPHVLSCVCAGELAFGFKLIFLDLVELLRYQWVGDKISELANYMYLPSIAMKMAFYVRFIVLPLMKEPSLYTAFCIATVISVGAGYLSFFFIISHNYEGVGFIGGPMSTLSREDSFVKRQAETSSNVGGKALAVLNGGLNYQIEHHLFPRLHHAHYHDISPTVRAFCEKKGVKYQHYSGVPENVRAMVRHLYKLGRPDDKFCFKTMCSVLYKTIMDKHD